MLGLHANAAIARDMQQAADVLDAGVQTANSLLAVSPSTSGDAAGSGSGGGGGEGGDGGGEEGGGGGAAGGHSKRGGAKSRDETIMNLAMDVGGKLPDDFDLELVEMKYPTDPKESMNTVLIQELARYNRLLAVIRSSMRDVQKAMRGLIVMSSSLEGVAGELFMGRVPTLWKGRSYPSRKPLAGYVADLHRRLEFFTTWIASGKPAAFWLPGFFFTQSFLTGVSQNYARKHVIPIDELAFDVVQLPVPLAAIATTPAPADGAHVHGMFLDGCRWDTAHGNLAECEPRVLFSPAPAMWLKPVRGAELRTFPHYSCPLYRTTERRGVLSTTGHSTNHVTNIRMPTDKPADLWVRRGVALVLALDD